MHVKSKLLYSVVALSAVALFGCGDGDDTTSKAEQTTPTYSFASRFDASKSSVSNPGQTARQVLIADLNTEISDGLGARITADSTSVDTPPEVLAILNKYYDGGTDSLGATPPIALKAPPLGTKQTAYFDAANLDISISAGKNLKGKIAGNDNAPGKPVTDHKPWNTPGTLVGFANTTPHDLVQTWLTDIATNTAAQANAPGQISNRPDPIDPSKTLKVFQSNDGHDLKQLVQKFLLGAVTFSQGTDDYLDDATLGKGLLAANVKDGTNDFTKLEHQFDEGFGYFGAARNYNDYTDDEIRGKGPDRRNAFKDGYNDADGDGKIDLFSEFNFGNSTNAAKRDAGSTSGTDFTKAIFDGFVAGRTIISKASDPLTIPEMDALKVQRDIIVTNWEKAIAATVVHYINEVVDLDMAKFGDPAYSYSNHIKHWGELKGFALGFQFNPRSPMNTGSRFADFHAKVGEKPVLPKDGAGVATAQAVIDAYRSDLLAARDILQAAYDFDPLDVAGW